MENVCAICLSGYVDEEGVCALNPCGHRFYTACIQQRLVFKETCPVCRAVSRSCQHGTLVAHEKHVLLAVIDTLQKHIRSIVQEATITEDTVLSLWLRLQVVLGDTERRVQQEVFYALIALHPEFYN